MLGVKELGVREITTWEWTLLVCSYCDSGTEFDELGEHSFGQDWPCKACYN